MKKVPLVEVIWEDTTSKSKWVDDDEVDDLDISICHTVGWKVKATRRYVIIANQRDETYGGVSDRHKIPRGCIREIRRLE